MNNTNWLLPEGVDEILPDDAARLEQLRRAIIDNLQTRNFSLVMPPVMEFLDSLLTGTGEELDTQTYKFMDQHTHRMLGIRADMTPQIARIDAHYLSHNEINRLCYAGTVLRTQSSAMSGPRELLQVGAELFGIKDESADIEIIEAMLSTLSISNLSDITLSLGHVAIYRQLSQVANIEASIESKLFDILLRKSFPDLAELQATNATVDLAPFEQLMKLQGNESMIDLARKQLAKSSEIDHALSQLSNVVNTIKAKFPELNIHIDLSDVFGYRYHTGLKFTAYVDGRGQAIAKGGRYDKIGEQFGQARAATGFSADLKSLMQLTKK